MFLLLAWWVLGDLWNEVATSVVKNSMTSVFRTKYLSWGDLTSAHLRIDWKVNRYLNWFDERFFKSNWFILIPVLLPHRLKHNIVQVSRMDFSLVSAIVDGLIFIIVVGMGVRTFIIQKRVENIEEIIVHWNNKAAELANSIEDAQHEAMEEFMEEHNAQMIQEWDNAWN